MCQVSKLLRGRVGLLLLHIARFWSVLLGGLAVLLAYLAGRLALPNRPWVALAGAAISAFVPTSLGVTDAVTNDALVPVTFGLALLAALALLRSPGGSPRRCSITTVLSSRRSPP